MKKIKLAIVSPYPPSKGTLNEYAYHLVEQFKGKNEISELTLITDKLPEGEKFEITQNGLFPIKVRDVWSFNSVKTPYQIWKAVRESKPDIVLYNIHFMSFGDKKIPAAAGLLTPLLTRLSGYPSVALLHNIVESVDLNSAGFSKNRMITWILRLIGTFLTRILLGSNMLAVTISKYVEILEEKYGTKKVALVPHGSFEVPPMPDFETPKGKRKIMTFGKFGTYKKVEMMIEAVEALRAKGFDDLEIVVAGSDSPNSQGYLAEVQNKYANVKDLTFTGYVAESDVPKVFGDSTVVVFPYTSTTGSSGVLHQAGSYGKACVLPNIGDLKMLIEEEGYIGEYFLPGQLDSLTTAIENLLTNEQLRKDQAQQNFAAATSLPMEDIADWYLLHFDRLLNATSNKERKAFKNEIQSIRNLKKSA